MCKTALTKKLKFLFLKADIKVYVAGFEISLATRCVNYPEAGNVSGSEETRRRKRGLCTITGLQNRLLQALGWAYKLVSDVWRDNDVCCEISLFTDET